MMSLAMVSTCLWAATASAATITLETFTGATLDGLPVDAEAVFVTAPGTLTITLRNLQDNPKSVIQCISGLSFTLGRELPGTPTLWSSSGLERFVNADRTYSDGSTLDGVGWLLSGSSLYLNDLAAGAAGPTHTLIGGPDGSGIYSEAGGSILGNKPHIPFLAGDVTFVLNIPGLTSDDTVKDALFQFGTSGSTVRAPDGGSSLFLLGMALSGVGLLRRKLT